MTTVADCLLRLAAHEKVAERVMDSDDIERGMALLSKNCATMRFRDSTEPLRGDSALPMESEAPARDASASRRR